MMHPFRFFLVVLLPAIFFQCSGTLPDTIVTESAAFLTGFEKPPQNPIMTADSSFVFLDPIADTLVRWRKADVFNPGAIAQGDSVYLFFRAEDNPRAHLGGRISRIGLAASVDGINFVSRPTPVLYPDNDSNIEFERGGGCEDPRVIHTPDGGYLMLYTGWNQEVARLCSATSKNMTDWEKHGPVFQDAYGGKFHDVWSKSGSVVGKKMDDGRIVATKINGKYWMYWGDAVVGLAHSDNLVDWTPVLNEDETLFDPIPPRRELFDSSLSEPGPPALLTDEGILLLYNGRNSPEDSLRSNAMGPGAYCGGQALFSAEDPAKLLARQDVPFICPSLPHEMKGQYASGTTFIQGLVRFQNKWFLYYGTADSMVGLAVSNE